jgi:hypothetical protein
MIVSPDPFLDTCFIKKPITNSTNSTNYLHSTNSINSINSTNYINKEFNNDISVNHLGKTINPIKESELEIKKETNLNVESIIKPNIDELREINIDLDLEDDPEYNFETISLKKPNQVYYEIYKTAREKAKKCKKEAMIAFLEAKNIKQTYMLDDIEDSESDMEDAEHLS